MELRIALFIMSVVAIAAFGFMTQAKAQTSAGPSACQQSAFLFSKMAVGTIQCNLPFTKVLAVFAGTATRFCGAGAPSKWAGSEAGGKAILAELKHNRTATCARLAKELVP